MGAATSRACNGAATSAINSNRILFIVMAFALPLSIQADTNSHRQAVEKLFKLTQMEQKINESVENVLLMQLQQNPGLDRHRQVLNDFLQKHIGWHSMKEELAAMYMDAFTEKKKKTQNDNNNSKDGTKRRRRERRMVEKTYKNEKGYLTTETVAEWVEIPTDEEGNNEEEAMKKESPKKKAKKAPKDMKQPTLMGFFKKK